MPPRKHTDDQKKIDFLLLCIKETNDFTPNWTNVGAAFNMTETQAEKQLADWRRGFRQKRVGEYTRLENEEVVDPAPKKVRAPKPKVNKRKALPDDEDESDSDGALKGDIRETQVAPRLIRKLKTKKPSAKDQEKTDDTPATAAIKDKDEDAPEEDKDSVKETVEDPEIETSGQAEKNEAELDEV